ncbi:hypothetical protein NDU88_006813 [Pleurodeles waltl]|uniref:Uncharacterized protein n=1 Tax=Pleurodeles waltl TaxID=8319 RepID=A0AAV7UQ49_PLEWA|nr:hypothetical protein NDU88_006813 [Pleurodeles waltl]
MVVFTGRSPRLAALSAQKHWHGAAALNSLAGRFPWSPLLRLREDEALLRLHNFLGITSGYRLRSADPVLPVRGIPAEQRLLFPRVHRELHGECAGHVPEGSHREQPGNYVSKIVCLVGSLPHSLRWISVFLHSWENELGLHQLLSHITLQRTTPQEEGQYSSNAESRPTDQHPRVRPGTVANAPLNSR